MKVVRLSVLRTGRLYPPGNISGTHFCYRLSAPIIGNKIKNLGLYLGTDFRYLPLYTSPIRNNALHDFPLIKMVVARFVGTGSFLVTYLTVTPKKHINN